MGSKNKTNNLNIPVEELGSEWRSNTRGILEKWEFALEKGLFADLTFVVGEKKEVMPCCRVVLKLHSSVFESRLKDPDEIIELPQYAPNIFKMFLKYLYTEKVDPTVEQALPLLQVAMDHKVEQLVRICTNYLMDKIDLQNSSRIYKRAFEFGEGGLASFAKKFILERADKVFQAKHFLELPLECLKALLESPERKIEELPAFLAMINWAKAETRRQGLEENGDNFQFVLKSAVDLIKYESLSLKDFSTCVVDTKILSDERMVQVFKKLAIGNTGASPSSIESSRVSSDDENVDSNGNCNAKDKVYQMTTQIAYKMQKGKIMFSGAEGRVEFTVNRQIRLHKLELHQVRDITSDEGDLGEPFVHLELFRDTELAKYGEGVNSKEENETYCLDIPEPITFEANALIGIAANVKGSFWPQAKSGGFSFYKTVKGGGGIKTTFNFKKQAYDPANAGFGKVSIYFTI